MGATMEPPMTEPGHRPLSDRLLEAATRIDELPRDDIARLLMKAAIRLRVIDQAGPKLEHIPVYAYHLLRRLSQEVVVVSTLFGQEDEAAVDFLVSRELAERGTGGRQLFITRLGQEVGEIADERSQRETTTSERGVG